MVIATGDEYLFKMSKEERAEKIRQMAIRYVRHSYEVNPKMFCSSKSLLKFEPSRIMECDIDPFYKEIGTIWMTTVREEFLRVCGDSSLI